MKVLFEHMATEIMLLMMLFIFSVFAMVDTQVLAARRIHSSVIDQMQASYYSISIDNINDQLHEEFPDWNINVEELNTYGTRKEYRIELAYNVKVPVFGIVKDAVIAGYVR